MILLCRYYDQLGAMENKLPMSEGQVSESKCIVDRWMVHQSIYVKNKLSLK